MSSSDKTLFQAALQWWRSSDGKIALEARDSNHSEAIALNRIYDGTSFVDSKKPHIINLAPGHARAVVVAHELGHSLGFPDCYFESWDQARKSFVYFELKSHQGNLMCSVDRASKIPDDYFVQLKNQYCSF